MNKKKFKHGIYYGLGIGVAFLFLSWLKPVRETILEKITPKEDDKDSSSKTDPDPSPAPDTNATLLNAQLIRNI